MEYQMLRTVKSKEDLLKMFKDEKKYTKFLDVESYCHKETHADFVEEMFELCGKTIPFSNLEDTDWDINKYQFESMSVIDKLISLTACCFELSKLFK
jgi:hypothetical protein